MRYEVEPLPYGEEEEFEHPQVICDRRVNENKDEIQEIFQKIVHDALYQGAFEELDNFTVREGIARAFKSIFEKDISELVDMPVKCDCVIQTQRGVDHFGYTVGIYLDIRWYDHRILTLNMHIADEMIRDFGMQRRRKREYDWTREDYVNRPVPEYERRIDSFGLPYTHRNGAVSTAIRRETMIDPNTFQPVERVRPAWQDFSRDLPNRQQEEKTIEVQLPEHLFTMDE